MPKTRREAAPAGCANASRSMQSCRHRTSRFALRRCHRANRRPGQYPRLARQNATVNSGTSAHGIRIRPACAGRSVGPPSQSHSECDKDGHNGNHHQQCVGGVGIVPLPNSVLGIIRGKRPTSLIGIKNRRALWKDRQAGNRCTTTRAQSFSLTSQISGSAGSGFTSKPSWRHISSIVLFSLSTSPEMVFSPSDFA